MGVLGYPKASKGGIIHLWLGNQAKTFIDIVDQKSWGTRLTCRQQHLGILKFYYFDLSPSTGKKPVKTIIQQNYKQLKNNTLKRTVLSIPYKILLTL